MMRRRQFLPISVLLAATASVVLLYMENRGIDAESHTRNNQLLLRTENTVVNLDRDVLRVTTSQLVQFDPLVATVNNLRRLGIELRNPERGLAGGSGEAVDQGITAFWEAVEKKLVLMERIKYQSALVQNGLHYLPLAVDDLVRTNHTLGDRLMSLLVQIFAFSRFHDSTRADTIEKELQAMEAIKPPGVGQGETLNNALVHIRANLNGIRELVHLQERYDETPTQNSFDKLYKAYADYHSAATKRAHHFSLLQVIVTIGLFFGLGLAINRMNRARAVTEHAWERLHDAVESLSEAFALFDHHGKLVLHNRRFLDFYPWLDRIVAGGLTLDDMHKENGKHLEVVTDEAARKADGMNVAAGNTTFAEKLEDGRWHLGSDNSTSDGGQVCVRVDVTRGKADEAELKKLSRAIEQSPVTVVMTDSQGNIEYVNPKFEQTTGYAAREVLGKNPRILKSGDKSPADYSNLWATIKSGKEWRGQFLNRRKDGSDFWEAASISPVWDSGGEITHFIAVKEDITAQKQAEEQLLMSAAVFDTTSEGIMITDRANRIRNVNPAFTKITGFAHEEVVGKEPTVLSSGHQTPDFYHRMWRQINASGHWSGEIWNRRKDGSAYPQRLSVSVVKGKTDEVEAHIGVFSDITLQKDNEERIRRQINYDPLTSLPNRSLLLEKLHDALVRAKRERWLAALLFVDLDHFKTINDTMGHETGDKLLRMASKRLRNSLRDTDTVARFGGDEFVIVLEDVGEPKGAADTAQKIIDIIVKPFQLPNREVHISASIGITFYPTDCADADTMLRHADMAMYQAKESGRNRYQFFTTAMNNHVRRRMEMEQDLRMALGRQELALEYQPIIDLKTGRCHSVETLLRWKHPQRGYVSPAKFVPVAEDTGLIAPIGLWVLQTAFRQLSEWRKMGIPEINLAINLSSSQQRLGLSASDVKQMLFEVGVPANAVKFEITEGLMMENSQEMRQWLDAFKGIGMELSVDDFGTGFSSLSYLKRFPMDELKIDRSFINDIPNDSEDASLVEAIIAIARKLRLNVVAEGVETTEQLAFLQNLGCDYIQGYLFSKPLPPERIPEVVRGDFKNLLPCQLPMKDVQPPFDTQPEPRTRLLAK